jgi:LPS-assembly lipoprotein
MIRCPHSYPVLRSFALVSFLLSLGLSGCGFHLRGSLDLPPSFSSVYVQGGNPYGELVTELRRALAGTGTRLVDRPEDAQAVLTLLGEDLNRRVLAVGSTGKAREYGLRLQVQFQATTPQGEVLVSPQSIYAVRDYSFDPTQVLGTADQETFLRREMVRDAVQQILLRLRAR